MVRRYPLQRWQQFKKYQQRRIDPFDVEKDLEEVRKQLYVELYGRNWEKTKIDLKAYGG